jgi:subtilisin-like proprotein convertase family protein
MWAKKKRIAALAACCGVVAALSTSALAQTNFPEVEPNDTKAGANAVGGATGMVATDTITGTTTGTSTTVAGDASSDNYLITVGAAPLGIYLYDLTLTSTIAGHTGTIRGLTSTGGVANAGTDALLQTSSTTTTPARAVRWYGFGQQEQLYYRVTGTATTTAPYTARLTRTTVTPIPVVGSVPPGTVNIVPDAATVVAYDTDFLVLDSNFNTIGGIDDLDGTGVTLSLAPGTYYIAGGSFNTTTNFAALQGTFVTGAVTDFPGILTNNVSSTNTTTYGMEIREGSNTGAILATATGTPRAGPTNPFVVDWFVFTVAVPTGPVISACTIAPGTGIAGTATTTTISSNAVPGSSGAAVSTVTADLSAVGGSSSVALTAGGGGAFSITTSLPLTVAPGTYALPITATDINGLTAQCSVSFVVSPVPIPGDDCLGAFPIVGGTASGTLVGATASPTGTLCTGSTIDAYYSFTAPAAGAYVVTLNPTNADFLSLVIDDDCTGFNGSLFCDFINNVPTVSDPLGLSAGQTILIRVAAFPGDEGPFTLTVGAAIAGACCNQNTGVCTVTTSGAAGCPAGTVYLGDNTACTPTNPCDPTGACCATTGTACTIRTVAGCASDGGIFLGLGTTCSPNPCQLGACCTSSGCSLTVSVQCGSGSTFLGVGSTCSTTALSYANTFSASPNIPIPDSPAPGISSTINVPTTFAFSNVSLQVNIPNHTFIADLVITLSKDGTSVLVWDDVCLGETGLTVTFSDAGSLVVCAEPTVGEILPLSPLSAFNSVTSNGDWTLTVADDTAIDTGTLVDWSIRFDRTAVVTSNCPAVAGGRCCVGSRCVTNVADAAACNALAFGATAVGVFTPGATDCNVLTPPTPNYAQPCCLADYNKVGGITTQDIFDFLGAWFSNNANANINGGPLEVPDIFDFLTAWFGGGC